jgi:geranylgeranyl diphosphate synthase type I
VYDKKILVELKKKIDPEIEAYFKKLIAETEKIDKDMARAIKHVQKIILSGGKRARAAFMYYGYVAAGGKDLKRIIRTTVGIELIHIFLLIHDDIMDQDDVRHGVTTVHRQYAKLGKLFAAKRDPELFGNSVAIIMGDLIGAKGNQVIYDSGFAPENIVRALSRLQDIVSLTCIGQTEDIYIENRGRAKEKEILHMYENKTARYTIEGPLHLGALLAGADEKFLKYLSAYAVPVGIAFQIQDDILGIFGQEKEMGKAVGADVRQGKQTILVAKALEKANREQKKILQATLGKKDLTKQEFADFKQVVVETGSLEYAKNLAMQLINEGKKSLLNPKMEIKKESKDFLDGIADYIISRVI